MKKLLILVISMAFIALLAVPALADPVMVTHDDVTLSGGSTAGHFPEIYDLTACNMTISFKVDLTGMVDDFGGDAHAWCEFGVREVGYGDFNPTWMAEGAGVWLSTDYEWVANTFDPDPVGAPTLDLDDKLILQKGGGMGEGSYNLPSAPPNPWANHAVWFDRDGVDQWQAAMWGAIDGVTYNTGGTYDIVITLHADDAANGTAYMTINGEPQGFYDPNWHPGPADLMPAGMTFTGDMTQMQVFYGMFGYGAIHTAVFEDISIEGCLYEIPVEVDIKPCSYPNSINLGSKGVTPVAVLTTDSFDASTIDPITVEFAGALPLRWVLEDVDYDGDIDMLFHFKTQELDLYGSSTDATLTGETTYGNPIIGTDSVNIVPSK
jgi:hypothetical protein